MDFPTEEQIRKAAERANQDQRKVWEEAIRIEERARIRKEVEGLKKPSEHHFHPDGEDNKLCELANCKWNAALQAVLSLLNS